MRYFRRRNSIHVQGKYLNIFNVMYQVLTSKSYLFSPFNLLVHIFSPQKCNDVLKSIEQMIGELRDEIKLIKNLIGPQIVATDVIRAVNALAKGKEIKVILIPCAGSLQLSLKNCEE